MLSLPEYYLTYTELISRHNYRCKIEGKYLLIQGAGGSLSKKMHDVKRKLTGCNLVIILGFAILKLFA